MNNQQRHDIIYFLSQRGVPLQHSVALLCKSLDRSLTEIAAVGGYHRNTLYKALSGETQLQPEMAKLVEFELGINPWKIDALARGTLADDRIETGVNKRLGG